MKIEGVTIDKASFIYCIMRGLRIKTISAFLFFLILIESNGQAPVISSIDKKLAATGSKVTLTGANFGNDPNQLKVFFGGAQATILSVTNQVLEAAVPSGATFENIAVINTTTGLVGLSSEQFLLSHSGEHPIGASNFQGQFDFQASSGLYDLCLCDLDNDGLNDIASVNDNTAPISLFLNTSTVGSLGFTKSTLSIAGNARTLHVQCGDLNGDGKQDLILSEGGNGNRVFILKNNSTPGNLAFVSQTITLAGKKPKRIEVSDLDKNGKADLIMTDQGNGNILILPNTSNLATISFGTLITIPVAGASSTDGLIVEDINGDQSSDIVTNQFLTPNGNLFVIENRSTPGDFKLNSPTTLQLPGTVVNIRAGDLDGDGKPDIAATQLLNSAVSIFLNQGSNGQIQFSSPTNILTDDRPWGIDFTDLDGDGKNDIVIASITTKSLTLLNNESTPGSLSFQRVTLGTTFINRHIRMGDLDGDAKPDIAFTSIDDNSLNIPSSRVSIFRNKNCVVPKVTPPGPITVCSNLTLRLISTEAPGATYEWRENGIPIIPPETNSFLDVTTGGQYSVRITGEGGGCIRPSNTVNVTEIAGAAPNTTITSNAPVCIGGNLSLSNTGDPANFNWTGPLGYSQNTTTGVPATRSSFKLEHAGRYNVDIVVGGCVADQKSIIVEAVPTPEFKTSFSGSDVVCAGGNKTLNVFPVDTDFTYQWFEKNLGSISGQTSTSYLTSTSGEFYFQAQSTLFPSCPPKESGHAKILIVSNPVPFFTAPAEACKDKNVAFIDQSTIDNQTTAFYSWDFNDGQSSADKNPTHSFSIANVYTVKLTVSYASGACSAQTTKSIQISSTPPSVNITAPRNNFKFCPGKSLELSVSGGTFTSYTWSTGATVPTITVTQPGTYSVEVIGSGGCTSTATRQIEHLSPPTVTIDADPSEITEGAITKLKASGLEDYLWEPGESLSDIAISNPIAKPKETTTYKVSGTGTNGCHGEATIEIIVRGEAIVNKLTPSNFFSPNGDAINNQWIVDNILTYPQCGINIYDDKGVKVYESKPYLNDWDGSFHGKPLPNGVYFYIIRCEGEESNPRTGSITLLR
jgi:gliding motility-associated-like protein